MKVGQRSRGKLTPFLWISQPQLRNGSFFYLKVNALHFHELERCRQIKALFNVKYAQYFVCESGAYWRRRGGPESGPAPLWHMEALKTIQPASGVLQPLCLDAPTRKHSCRFNFYTCASSCTSGDKKQRSIQSTIRGELSSSLLLIWRDRVWPRGGPTLTGC